ncbi:hypothetical protein Trydic_g6254 [Trypoxylus dichotomus]
MPGDYIGFLSELASSYTSRYRSRTIDDWNPLSITNRRKQARIRKIWIYRTVYRPIITYVSAVWSTAATTDMRKLQTLQNRMLQMALNALWFVRNTTLHEDARVESLIDFIRKIAAQFFDRAINHWNRLVSTFQDYDPRIPWRYPRLRPLIVDHQD